MSACLSDSELERAVRDKLVELGVSFEWKNRHGESMDPEDFRVLGVHLDCKGSEKYYGSGFISLEDARHDMDRVRDGDPVWYVTNDFRVIALEEIVDCVSWNQGPVTWKPFFSRKWNSMETGIRFVGSQSLEEWVDDLKQQQRRAEPSLQGS